MQLKKSPPPLVGGAGVCVCVCVCMRARWVCARARAVKPRGPR
jgi:hypothetical protein